MQLSCHDGREHQPSNLRIVRSSSVFNTACFRGMAILTPFTSAVCLYAVGACSGDQ